MTRSIEEQCSRAEDQRLRAEANLAKALEAVDVMLTHHAGPPRRGGQGPRGGPADAGRGSHLQYYLATQLMQAATMAEGAEDLSEEERTALVELYRTGAVRALETAVGNGFRDPGGYRDEVWDPVRGTAPFEAAIAGG